MRVFSEATAGGQIVEITDTAEGRFAAEYAAEMLAYGLTESEIEEDLGGGVFDDGRPFDGAIKWACEAAFRVGDLYLGDPGVYVPQN